MSSTPIRHARKLPCHAPNQATKKKIRDLSRRSITSNAIQPTRLQKILAASGVGSRRDIEKYILRGEISVNQKVAQLGQKITPNDRVFVNQKFVRLAWPHNLPRIIVYHKPEGEIVSRKDPEGRISVFDRLPKIKSSCWISIGRLDLNSSGLLIFTTDGELANHFAHPRFEIEREYAVRILGSLTETQKNELYKGITLKTGVAHVTNIQETVNNEEASNQWYRITLKEGKNREVRELFAALGLTVSRLIRIRFGSILLPSRLKRGQYYELNAIEVANVIKWLKLSSERLRQSSE